MADTKKPQGITDPDYEQKIKSVDFSQTPSKNEPSKEDTMSLFGDKPVGPVHKPEFNPAPPLDSPNEEANKLIQAISKLKFLDPATELQDEAAAEANAAIQKEWANKPLATPAPQPDLPAGWVSDKEINEDVLSAWQNMPQAQKEHFNKEIKELDPSVPIFDKSYKTPDDIIGSTAVSHNFDKLNSLDPDAANHKKSQLGIFAHMELEHPTEHDVSNKKSIYPGHFASFNSFPEFHSLVLLKHLGKTSSDPNISSAGAHPDETHISNDKLWEDFDRAFLTNNFWKKVDTHESQDYDSAKAYVTKEILKGLDGPEAVAPLSLFHNSKAVSNFKVSKLRVLNSLVGTDAFDDEQNRAHAKVIFENLLNTQHTKSDRTTTMFANVAGRLLRKELQSKDPEYLTNLIKKISVAGGELNHELIENQSTFIRSKILDRLADDPNFKIDALDIASHGPQDNFSLVSKILNSSDLSLRGRTASPEFLDSMLEAKVKDPDLYNKWLDRSSKLALSIQQTPGTLLQKEKYLQVGLDKLKKLGNENIGYFNFLDINSKLFPAALADEETWASLNPNNKFELAFNTSSASAPEEVLNKRVAECFDFTDKQSLVNKLQSDFHKAIFSKLNKDNLVHFLGLIDNASSLSYNAYAFLKKIPSNELKEYLSPLLANDAAKHWKSPPGMALLGTPENILYSLQNTYQHVASEDALALVDPHAQANILDFIHKLKESHDIYNKKTVLGKFQEMFGSAYTYAPPEVQKALTGLAMSNHLIATLAVKGTLTYGSKLPEEVIKKAFEHSPETESLKAFGYIGAIPDLTESIHSISNLYPNLYKDLSQNLKAADKLKISAKAYKPDPGLSILKELLSSPEELKKVSGSNNLLTYISQNRDELAANYDFVKNNAVPILNLFLPENLADIVKAYPAFNVAIDSWSAQDTINFWNQYPHWQADNSTYGNSFASILFPRFANKALISQVIQPDGFSKPKMDDASFAVLTNLDPAKLSKFINGYKAQPVFSKEQAATLLNLQDLHINIQQNLLHNYPELSFQPRAFKASLMSEDFDTKEFLLNNFQKTIDLVFQADDATGTQEYQGLFASYVLEPNMGRIVLEGNAINAINYINKTKHYRNGKEVLLKELFKQIGWINPSNQDPGELAKHSYLTFAIGQFATNIGIQFSDLNWENPHFPIGFAKLATQDSDLVSDILNHAITMQKIEEGALNGIHIQKIGQALWNVTDDTVLMNMLSKNSSTSALLISATPLSQQTILPQVIKSQIEDLEEHKNFAHRLDKLVVALFSPNSASLNHASVPDGYDAAMKDLVEYINTKNPAELDLYPQDEDTYDKTVLNAYAVAFAMHGGKKEVLDELLSIKGKATIYFACKDFDKPEVKQEFVDFYQKHHSDTKYSDALSHIQQLFPQAKLAVVQAIKKDSNFSILDQIKEFSKNPTDNNAAQAISSQLTHEDIEKFADDDSVPYSIIDQWFDDNKDNKDALHKLIDSNDLYIQLNALHRLSNTGLLEPHEAKILQQAKDVFNFWQSYERRVNASHFAKIKSAFLMNDQRTTVKHRGIEGDSDSHSNVSNDMLRRVAKAYQKMIVRKSYIPVLKERLVQVNGKPHLMCNRGVDGPFARDIHKALGIYRQSDTSKLDNADKSATYNTLGFESWAVNLKASYTFGYNKYSEGHDMDTQTGLIFSKTMPMEQVLYAGFLNILRNQNHEHQGELEIMGLNPAPLHTLTFNDVIEYECEPGEKVINHNNLLIKSHPSVATTETGKMHYDNTVLNESRNYYDYNPEDTRSNNVSLENPEAATLKKVFATKKLKDEIKANSTLPLTDDDMPF